MINTTPNPRYPQLRVASAMIALIALAAVTTEMAGSGTVLAWAVAIIALTIFGASFYLKP